MYLKQSNCLIKKSSFNLVNWAHLLLFKLLSALCNRFCLFITSLFHQFLCQWVNSLTLVGLNLSLILGANLADFSLHFDLEAFQILLFNLVLIVRIIAIFVLGDHILWLLLLLLLFLIKAIIIILRIVDRSHNSLLKILHRESTRWLEGWVRVGRAHEGWYFLQRIVFFTYEFGHEDFLSIRQASVILSVFRGWRLLERW